MAGQRTDGSDKGAEEGAFVVWLDECGDRAFRGRVEHVATATRRGFASHDELIAFLRLVDREQEAE